jgi:glyoxylase-like metal-dependent hydrolase (beta-lactamase superfamily II)
MRIRTPGKVTDNLWYLGREETGVYYLKGKDGAVMINGGMSYILPDVLTQMKEFGLDPGKLTKLLILHSHFDHVGIVPYFKRTYPSIEVVASAPAWEVLAKPKAIDTINDFSQLSARRVNGAEALQPYDLQWRNDIAGPAVGEGDQIDLGSFVLRIIAAPGHSNCSICAYEPRAEILFASDAVGVPFKEDVFPSMNTNVQQYLESLLKLRSLSVSYLCLDHSGHITGEEAERFADITLEEALRWKAYLEEVYRKHNGDIDAAAKEITAYFCKRMPGYFIAPEILEMVFKHMVKYIGKTLQ